MLERIWNRKPGRKRRKSKRKINFSDFHLGSERRLQILAGLWGLLIIVVVLKLLVVQGWQSDLYRDQARGYLENRREIAPQRGSIVDRNGQLLAVDLIHYSLGIKPNLLQDRNTVIARIADILGMPVEQISRKVARTERFTYIGHRISLENAEKIMALKAGGVILEKKFSRYYPYDKNGAHLIGYCDYENKARAGLEMKYNDQLQGQPGWSVYLRDALGNQFPNLDFPASEAVNGNNMELTVDMVYQGIMEDELRKAILKHQADDGAVVLLEPATGKVLGMANYPGFNPNRYNQYSLQNYRNRAASDLYEPGSTFKMVALAMCIEQLGLDLDQELVFCENGRYKLASKEVKDHKNFAYLTARQVFENSSNIGVIKLAERFDPPIFYRYARDFGFGAPTGVDLPAEASGILHKPSSYSSVSMSYMSMGYEVAATPLQLAASYAAIANDGVLMKPYIVERIVNENGRTVLHNKPEMIRQVVLPETARKMKVVLEGAVTDGTGKTARVSGLTIAGKTGTAQKIDAKNNSYSSTAHIASFVGLFPVDAPRFVLLVVVNNPRKGYYGSHVAAPVFQKIATRIVGLPVYEGDNPVPILAKTAQLELPSLDSYMVSLEGLDVGKAVRILRENRMSYELVGGGKVVYRQDPPPFSRVSNSGENRSTVRLYTEKSQPGSNQRMPELKGLSLKEALQVLDEWNIPVEIEGSGVVVEQKPGAGQKMQADGKIILVCKST